MLPLEGIRDCFEGVIPAAMATVGADGVPNIAYLSQVQYVDHEHVALSYQFFNKTRRNILARPLARLQVTSPSLPPPPPRNLLPPLRDALQRLSCCADLESLLARTLDALHGGFGVSHAMVLMADSAQQRLYTVASCGYGESGVGSETPFGQGVIGVAARECTPISATTSNPGGWRSATTNCGWTAASACPISVTTSKQGCCCCRAGCWSGRRRCN